MRDTKGLQVSWTYSFGEWLKQRRQRLRLTQREVAATVYCSVPMIKKIEADERYPSVELAEQLAVTLQVPKAQHELFVQIARGERPVDLLGLAQNEKVTISIPFHAPIALPKAATPFVGRVDEVAEIGERLANPNCHLLTLTGPGGIGKTRLALAVAEAQQSTFADGVAFVPLAAMTDAGMMAEMVARALRLTLSGSPAEELLAYLHRRNTLLVLDNCEQLEGDLAWLSELLAHAPGVKVLATSRERLRLAGEWVYVVPGLAQAVELFVATAQRVSQGFDPEREKSAILHICQLVENLPLAVELAAGWRGLMPAAQIAAQIERDILMLATDLRNVPDRHRSIQALFDHSWQLLSSVEQEALMRLSLFRGGWQVAEAQVASQVDLLLLRRLVDKSLVRAGENGRFELHELIRHFAAGKLRESGAENESRQRHFDAYLTLAAQLDAQQYSPQGMEVFARFEQEQENLRAALAWSLDSGQVERTLRLLYHLYFYWFRRGHSGEGERWTTRAIALAGEHESALLCIALHWAFAFTFNQGRYGEAMPYLAKLLPMARRLEDAEALVMALMADSWGSDTADEALTRLNEAIAILRQTENLQHLLPLFYYTAGIWLQRSGRNEEAKEYYQRSLDLYQQMGAVEMSADSLGLLGELALQEGHLQEAYDLTFESITIARAVGRQVVFGDWGGVQLGLIQLYLGELDTAEATFQAALLRLESVTHDLRGKQDTLSYLSEVALARGDITIAAEYLQASLNICRILYQQLQATEKLAGTADALPVELSGLCARAALVAAAQGEYEHAVTLAGIANALCLQNASVMLPPLQARLDEAIANARAFLAENAFAIAWNHGQTMPLSQAFAFLLS